ncbi:kinase-like domain-containing protein [Rhizophagus irregularis DAOM 181602=DAOM 197198]|nr:kinase-like domain-containing protein [Rhizophagus irregularis DAOM 181602=DAOM 197198]
MSDKNENEQINLIEEAISKILHELKLQCELDLYDNVIRLYGITEKGSQNVKSNKYLLVMEYTDGDSLQNYLKENFKNLTWPDKYRLAYQLVCAISCLHDEGIIHRDLHSDNIIVHQNNIKLVDFGLSKRIKEICKHQTDLFGLVPYTDPKRFTGSNKLTQPYLLNKKSDVYSIGVLLWEISSGKLPFEDESYDAGLVMRILQGYRETIVPNSPSDYSKLYTECWNSEPDNRPTMDQVVVKLKEIIMKTNVIVNSQMRIDSDNVDKSNVNLLYETNMTSICLSNLVDELVNLIYKKLNEGNDKEVIKQNVLFNISNHKLTSKEIYTWLLNNQNNSNSIILLGYLNYYGIETDINVKKAYELFQKAADLDNNVAQLYLIYLYIIGQGVDKNYKFAFELSNKLAKQESACGINYLGYCYEKGMGTDIDKQKAFELYQKAADLGNSNGIGNLGYCYGRGIGTDVNMQMAFELTQKAADLGNSYAMDNLGQCYNKGIGTDVNAQKAFELFQKSADLGSSTGLSSLGTCYEKGIGTDVNVQKAFELNKKAADLGNTHGMNNLGRCYRKGIGIDINLQKAFEFYQKSADLGDSYGMNNLGNCYRKGVGTDINKQKAFEIYQKAAQLESDVAQYNLALMYESGDGIKKDIDQAIYWYKKSAERGHKNAQNKLDELTNTDVIL